MAVRDMSRFGRKYTCYACSTKFYDLNRPEPLCPRCGADQRQAPEQRTDVVTLQELDTAPIADDAPDDEDAVLADDELEIEPDVEDPGDLDGDDLPGSALDL